MSLMHSQEAQRLRIALQVTHTCLFELSLADFTYTYFENAHEIFGLDDAQLCAMTRRAPNVHPAAYHRTLARRLVHPDDYESMLSLGQELQTGYTATAQLRLRHTDGSFRWCKITLTPVQQSDGSLQAIGLIADIQNFRSQAEKLAGEARIDHFTGLYHKIQFEKMAEAVLRNHPTQRHALILLDLDNFDEFNRTYGKLRGDSVLRAVAASLRTACRPHDLVGRFGGDEFIVLLQNVPDRAAVTEKVAALLERDDGAMQVTKSAGVSLYPDDAAKFSNLLHLAEVALHTSKQEKHSHTAAQNYSR